MAHNIFGERFIARREKAWHGIGQIFPEDQLMSPLEAIIRSGCDYKVEKHPATVTLPNGKVLASDRVALVRTPADIPIRQADGTYNLGADPNADDYHILGWASQSYEVVNNVELGVLLDELGKTYPVESVGALGNGETIFICLRTGVVHLNGNDTEEICLYITISNNHDGKRALHIMLTPVRTVCQNTLILGTQQAMVTAAIPHTLTVREDAEFHLKIISSVRRQQETMIEQFSALAQHNISDEQADAIIAKAYPDPRPTRKSVTANVMASDPSVMAMIQDDRTIAEKLLGDISKNGELREKQWERVTKLREAAVNRYHHTGDVSPKIAGTAWAVYQGITEVENFRGTTSKETATSILFGERAEVMGRGYKACLELITV